MRSRLEASGFDKLAGRRVVLTGGASQLPGVRELAQLVLDKQVRMGRPLRIAGLAEATGGPAFSTAAGLIAYAIRRETEMLPQLGRAMRVGAERASSAASGDGSARISEMADGVS